MSSSRSAAGRLYSKDTSSRKREKAAASPRMWAQLTPRTELPFLRVLRRTVTRGASAPATK